MAGTRRWAGIVVALALVCPRAAAAQSADEEAAFILYESGKERFKSGDFQGASRDLERAYRIAPNEFIGFYLGLSFQRLGRCDDALPQLENLAGRLAGEQEAVRVAALSECLLLRVEEQSKAGDCDQANRTLQKLPPTLDGQLAARKGELIGACEIGKAQRMASSSRCREALEVLGHLPSSLAGATEARRRDLVRTCSAQVVGFVPESAEQRAALVFVQQGLNLAAAEQHAEAVTKFERALLVYDEPHIRLHAARSLFALSSCPEALSHADVAVRTLPDAAAEIAGMRDWCDHFYLPPGTPPDKKVRASVLARYHDAVPLKPGSLDILLETLKDHDHPKVRRFVGRAMIAQGRFADAVPVLQGAEGRLPGQEKDLSRDIERALFGAMDGNENPAKMDLHTRFDQGRAAFEAGDLDQAESLLGAIAANPFVARVRAQLLARRGECDAAAKQVALAAAKLKLADGWTAGLMAECQAEAARVEERRSREQREAAESARAGRIRTKRVVSYVLWATGVAAAGVAGYYAYAWSSERSASIDAMREYDLAASTADARAARARVVDHRSTQQTNAIIAGCAGAAAAGLIAGGIVTWVQADALASAPVTAAPMLGPGAVGLAIQGGF